MIHDESEPRIEIIEQPFSNRYRFRYKRYYKRCDRIFGIKSTKIRRTFPKIRIVGLNTPAEITVSCLTARAPYRVHPHELLRVGGPLGNGIIRDLIVPPHDYLQLESIGVLMTKIEDYAASLEQRKNLHVDPFKYGYDHLDGNVIDQYAIRLCFEARLLDTSGQYYIKTLRPVISWPLVHEYARSRFDIVDFVPCSAPLAGGGRLQIFGYDILPDDVQVKFSHEIPSRFLWEKIVDPLPRLDEDCPKAITVITPRYSHPNINRVIYVRVQLMSIMERAIGNGSFLSLCPPEDSGNQVDLSGASAYVNTLMLPVASTSQSPRKRGNNNERGESSRAASSSHGSESYRPNEPTRKIKKVDAEKSVSPSGRDYK